MWEEPATAIADTKLDRNPDGPHPFDVDEVVDCTFKPGGAAGSTPKFDCELPGGERVKVKYGRSKFVDPVNGGSTRAEIDAFRLLAVFLGHWENKRRRLRRHGQLHVDDAPPVRVKRRLKLAAGFPARER